MLAKLIEKEKAIELRKKGLSIIKIAQELNVSKSSISMWVRGLPQPEKFTKDYRASKKEERKNALIKIREKRDKENFPSDEKIEEHANSIKLGGAPGTEQKYKYGCRCNSCIFAHNEKMKLYRKKRDVA